MHPNHPFEVIIPGAEDTEGIAHTREKPHESILKIFKALKDHPFEIICQKPLII
jgi:hypothetical protein